MKFWTMSLLAILFTVISIIATPIVLTVGNGLQVARTHTSTIATEVVQFLTHWDRSDFLFVAPAMGEYVSSASISSTTDLKEAIAVRNARSGPQPTLRRLFDFRPESYFDRHLFSWQRQTPHLKFINPL